MGWAMEDTAMELNREGAANFEQLKDLIRREWDKRDRRYAHLEDKYKRLEHQLTNEDQQKNMAKRGRQTTSDGQGASKKNKSDQRQAANQQSNHPRRVPPNNTGQTNRRKSENPGQAVENNSSTRTKNKNKPTLPSQNKSDWNQRNAPGRKKPPQKQHRKN